MQGVNWNGSMRVRGNVLKGTTSGNAVITLKADPNGAGNAAMHGFFDISTEADDGKGTVNPASITFADQVFLPDGGRSASRTRAATTAPPAGSGSQL